MATKSEVAEVGVTLGDGQTARLVDLSQPIHEGMPVYPGHLKTVVWRHHTHEETARLPIGVTYATNGLLLSDHGPTHVDAPNHIDSAPDAAAIDELPLSRFLTPAVCVDCSTVAPGSSIDADELSRRVAAQQLDPPAGGTVLIWLGHYERAYGSDAWLETYAGLSGSAVEWLADRDVVNVGIDAPSLDASTDKGFPAHAACRDRELLNTENLANLGQVAGRRFTFVGLPLRIRGGTASPIRAAALLHD